MSAQKTQRSQDRPVEAALRVSGRVVEQLPNALYRVELTSGGRPQITAHASGESGLLRLRPGGEGRRSILPCLYHCARKSWLFARSIAHLYSAGLKLP